VCIRFDTIPECDGPDGHTDGRICHNIALHLHVLYSCSELSTGVGDLKWSDSNGNEHLAESDHDKSEALQEFFSSMYNLRKNLLIYLR